MKRILKLLWGLLPVLALMAIQFVAAMFLAVIYGIYVGVRYFVRTGPTEGFDMAVFMEEALSGEALYNITAITVVISGIVFFFWYRRMTKGKKVVTMKWLLSPRNIALLVFLGIGGQFLMSGAMGFVQPFFQRVFEDYSETIGTLFSGHPIIVILNIVIIAPIVEELVFRGVLLNRLKYALPLLGANVLQALIFGIYHWNIVQGIYASIMGLIFGYIAIKFKSVGASILFHMAINASAFIVMNFGENYAVYSITLISGMLIFGLVMMKIHHTVKPVFRTIEIDAVDQDE